MPDTILGRWISKAEEGIEKNSVLIKEVSDDLHDHKEKEFAVLRLDFERFKVEIKTKNKIIWILVTTVLAASGVIIALISMLHNIKDTLPQ